MDTPQKPSKKKRVWQWVKRRSRAAKFASIAAVATVPFSALGAAMIVGIAAGLELALHKQRKARIKAAGVKPENYNKCLKD